MSDCGEIRPKLQAGTPPDDDVRRHLAECPACAELAHGDPPLARELAEVLAASAPAGEPPPTSADPAGEPPAASADPAGEPPAASADPAGEPPASRRGAALGSGDAARDPASSPPGAPFDLDALKAAVGRDLAAERGWRGRLRGLATPWRVVIGVAAGLVAVASGLAMRRPDLGVYPVARLLIEVGLLGMVALGSGWAVLRPLHRPPLSRGVGGILLLAALLLPWVLALLPAAHLAHPASLAGTGDDLVPRALACFIYAGVLGLPAAAALALVRRGGLRAARVALLPAGAGALAGLLGLHLHCPLTAPVHLLVGHAPVALTLVLVAALGHLLLRRRSTTPGA